jgi:hypothetical protein
MAKPKAVYVKGVGRLSIDGPIEVVMREKARFTERLGWSYRFRSGEEWLLVPLEDASVFVYADRPEATSTGSSSGQRRSLSARVPHAANYVTPEGDLVE